ncbi:MAG: hypothetical protein AB1492_08560 [Bacillota bacterium]
MAAVRTAISIAFSLVCLALSGCCPQSPALVKLELQLGPGCCP